VVSHDRFSRDGPGCLTPQSTRLQLCRLASHLSARMPGRKK
jgi:hypothetical protein